MWQTVLSNAKQALYMNNIEAESGYPAEKYRDITEPVCRVNLKSADMLTGKYTLLVQIQSPVSLGAEGCERMAHDAAKALMPEASECHIGVCDFDGRTGLFFVEITAVYETHKPTVMLNDITLKFVRSFTSWRGENSQAGSWAEVPREFEIVEFVPAGRTEQAFPEENFTVFYTRNGRMEQYNGCRWTYWKQEEQLGGILRTWRGTAEGASVSTAE